MSVKEIKSMAVLMTCHNRREKTLICLDSLFQVNLPSKFRLDVFLVDDGSTDGTGEFVKKAYPDVNVINGSGDLFWNQGMRLAWTSAINKGKYDFFIWLNDDTVLDEFAIVELLECHNQVVKSDNCSALITGACRDSFSSRKFSYGGRTQNESPVIPNGDVQKCYYINGNIVLIPDVIFQRIGNLSSSYTHAIGDNDYGLRAIKAGFSSYTTKEYIAVCKPNAAPSWSNPNVSLKKRLVYFHSPLGLNYKEYIHYHKKYWKTKWILFALTAYAKVLFPRAYIKLTKTIDKYR